MKQLLNKVYDDSVYEIYLGMIIYIHIYVYNSSLKIKRSSDSENRRAANPTRPRPSRRGFSIYGIM